MAVDVTMMEPTPKVDLKPQKQATTTTRNDEVSSLKSVVRDTPETDVETKSVDKFENNYKNTLNYSLKNTIEATTVSLQAETALDKMKTILTDLRDKANNIGLGNLSENELFQAQYDFETQKNSLNRISTETSYKGQNLFETLNNEGIQYPINKETTINIAFNKTEEVIEGFNKNKMTLENLNLFNTENAVKVTDSLNKAINYIDDKKNDLDDSQNTINNELTKLLSNNEGGYTSINSKEDAQKETNSVAALILGNSNETSMAQANSRYENYLNLLKVTSTTETEV